MTGVSASRAFSARFRGVVAPAGKDFLEIAAGVFTGQQQCPQDLGRSHLIVYPGRMGVHGKRGPQTLEQARCHTEHLLQFLDRIERSVLGPVGPAGRFVFLIFGAVQAPQAIRVAPVFYRVEQRVTPVVFDIRCPEQGVEETALSAIEVDLACFVLQ